MEFITEIKNWFNSGKPYDSGVQLYLKYGADDMVKKLFSEKETAFKRQRLDDVMREMLEPTTLTRCAVDVETETRNTKPDTSSRTLSWEESTDPVLTALRERWKPLYARMMDLCHRVGDVAYDGRHDVQKEQEAGRMALEILDLDDACYAIYAERDYYLEHGKLPVKDNNPVEISIDPKRWPTALANHQKYARDYRAKLKNDPGNAKYAVTLKKHEWAVGEYKRLMGIA